MIFYVTTKKHRYTVDEFLATWGQAFSGRLEPIGYDTLFRRRSLLAGSYIFSDLERLSPEELERAAGAWSALHSSGRAGRLLNHPTRSMRRYELLRELQERGINDFGVYRATEARRPRRYPVFLRRENDHLGCITELLQDPDELEGAIERLTAAGQNRDTLMIAEFNAAPDRRGLYRKYGAFIVGDRIIPRHLLFGRHWHLKFKDFVDEQTVAEELDYLKTNPHERELREIFQIARIDYGRIDYGLVDGHIQVYEINTNPLSLDRSDAAGAMRLPVQDLFARNFMAALEEADCPSPPRPAIAAPGRAPQYSTRPSLVQEVVCALLRLLGLRRYQSLVLTRLRAMKPKFSV